MSNVIKLNKSITNFNLSKSQDVALGDTTSIDEKKTVNFNQSKLSQNNVNQKEYLDVEIEDLSIVSLNNIDEKTSATLTNTSNNLLENMNVLSSESMNYLTSNLLKTPIYLNNSPLKISTNNNISQSTKSPENIIEVSCTFDKVTSKNDKNIDNAIKYIETFQKYGEMYGIDYRILLALACQESSGEHERYLSSAYPAAGIMQIEKLIWIGNSISAYNFKTKEEDTLNITSSNLQDVNTNIQAGTMILRESIDKTIEYGYEKDKIKESDILSYSLQRYNMGSGNMVSLLEKGGKENWMNYRESASGGDAKYFEHVFTFLDQIQKLDTINNDNPITIMKSDGSSLKFSLKRLEN